MQYNIVRMFFKNPIYLDVYLQFMNILLLNFRFLSWILAVLFQLKNFYIHWSWHQIQSSVMSDDHADENYLLEETN